MIRYDHAVETGYLDKTQWRWVFPAIGLSITAEIPRDEIRQYVRLRIDMLNQRQAELDRELAEDFWE